MLADLVNLSNYLENYRGVYSKVTVAYTVCDGTELCAGS